MSLTLPQNRVGARAAGFGPEDEPLTAEERYLCNLQTRLDEAFRRDPSIGAMNRVYRELRTGGAEIDEALRGHIGLLYRFEEARSAGAGTGSP